MSELHAQEPSETSAPDARRSRRIQISIPIIIAGTDASGRAFKESTRTIAINKHGGKISTFHQLGLESEITIENRRLGRTAQASVVWLGERRSVKEPTQIGIQLFEAQNIWGVDFTPEDWKEVEPSRVLLKPANATESPLTTNGAVESASAGSELPPAVMAESSASSQSLNPPEAGTSATTMDRDTQARLKDFEDRLRALAASIGSEAEASVQAVTKGIEDRLAGSVEARLQPLLQRFETIHAQARSLLAQVEQTLQATQQQNEKAQAESEAARARALEGIEQVVSEKVSRTFERSAMEAPKEFEAVLKRLSHNAAASWTRETTERLNQMTEEHLRSAASTFADRAAEAYKEAEDRLRSTAEGFTAQWRSALETDTERVSGLLQSELEKRLQESAERVTAEMVRSLEGQVKTSLTGMEASLQAPMQKMREQIHLEIDNADLRARKYCEQEVERAERIATDHMAARAEKAREALAQAAEEARAEAQRDTERVMQDFRGQAVAVSQALLDGLKEQASGVTNASLHHLEVECSKTLAAQLATAQQEFLRAAMPSLAEGLKASRENSFEEARKYLTALGKTTVEALNREAIAGLDRFRHELRRLAAEDMAVMVERLNQARSEALNEAQEFFRKSVAQVFSSLGTPAKRKESG